MTDPCRKEAKQRKIILKKALKIRGTGKASRVLKGEGHSRNGVFFFK